MNVLFVEDDAMNRMVVRDMLTTVDVAMAEAESAEIGLGMIEDHDFDVVLMDLRMPGMDGFTAIERIRARGDAKAALPIIVISADAAPDLGARCLAAGAQGLIGKPVPMDQLFDALVGVMGAPNDYLI